MWVDLAQNESVDVEKFCESLGGNVHAYRAIDKIRVHLAELIVVLDLARARILDVQRLRPIKVGDRAAGATSGPEHHVRISDVIEESLTVPEVGIGDRYIKNPAILLVDLQECEVLANIPNKVLHHLDVAEWSLLL